MGHALSERVNFDAKTNIFKFYPIYINGVSFSMYFGPRNRLQPLSELLDPSILSYGHKMEIKCPVRNQKSHATGQILSIIISNI